MKATPCKKCGNRYKLLSREQLCYKCDPVNWRKLYRTSEESAGKKREGGENVSEN